MANPLPALPLEMAALQNIKKLNLDAEMMESPPTEVAAKGWPQTQAYLMRVAHSLKTGVLHLDEMSLRRFPAPVCLMTELTELSMHDNNIKVVPEAVGKLQALTSLNLTNNQLSTLPASVSKLMLLKHLLVDHNPIRTLPPELGTLKMLQNLTVDADVLESPPRDILAKGSVQKILQYLQLLVAARTTLKLPFSDFELQDIPAAVFAINNLSVLVLSNNRIGNCPKELCDFANIKEIYLNNNALRKLPSNIGKLGSLEVLHVQFNQIVELPNSLRHCESIVDLRVNDNLLIALPPGLWQMKGLTMLDVTNKNLKVPPEDVVAKGTKAVLAYLKVVDSSSSTLNVDMSAMGLRAFPNEVLQMTTLTDLKLTNNYLTRLPTDIDRMLCLLRLQVAYNQLSVIPQSIGNLQPHCARRQSDIHAPRVYMQLDITHISSNQPQPTALVALGAGTFAGAGRAALQRQHCRRFPLVSILAALAQSAPRFKQPHHVAVA